MKTNKLREIDRLVSEMHDDELSGDDLHRLEELLRDDPAAQRHYWQLVNGHIALSVAVSSNSLPVDSPRTESAVAAPAVDSTVTASRWWLAAAAVLLLSLLGTSLWKGQGDAPQLASAGSTPDSAWSEFDEMPTITQVSWEGPSFAADSNGWQPAAVTSAGPITLRVKEGEVADGYLFCLLPGDSVNLMATFDATGENSLSVVEILDDERATLKKVSFHNSGAGPKPLHANPHVRNRRYGILGHWSETNTSDVPRYFLLTGVHKLAQPKPNESWRLSKIAVMVESDQAVHLGWDDSGPAPLAGDNYHEDFDYDDLAASLLFDRRTNTANHRTDQLQVLKNDQLSAPTAPSALEGGFVFELPPHSAAVLKAVSEARARNAIVAVDTDTQELLWSSSQQVAQSPNLGAACLLNPTPNIKRIRLLGIHQPPDAKGPGVPWRASAQDMLYEQPGFFILGFDDSLGDKDFDDVRVSVLTTALP